MIDMTVGSRHIEHDIETPRDTLKRLARGTISDECIRRYSTHISKGRFYRATVPGLRTLEPSIITSMFDGVYLTDNEKSAILYREHDIKRGAGASLYRCEIRDVRLFSAMKSDAYDTIAAGFANFVGNMMDDADWSYLGVALLEREWRPEESYFLLNKDSFLDCLTRIRNGVLSGNPVERDESLSEVSGFLTEYAISLGFDGVWDSGTAFSGEREVLMFYPGSVRILDEEQLTKERLNALMRRLDRDRACG